MENASKALIIAGAVLVSIMIVALGVTIFNKAHSSADTTALDSTEITMFNQKFERFAGQSQSGSNVKSLISFAIANASTNKDEPMKLPEIIFYYDKQTNGSYSNFESKMSNIRAMINSTHTYRVVLGYNDTSGFVDEINIYE